MALARKITRSGNPNVQAVVPDDFMRLMLGARLPCASINKDGVVREASTPLVRFIPNVVDRERLKAARPIIKR